MYTLQDYHKWKDAKEMSDKRSRSGLVTLEAEALDLCVRLEELAASLPAHAPIEANAAAAHALAACRHLAAILADAAEGKV